MHYHKFENREQTSPLSSKLSYLSFRSLQIVSNGRSVSCCITVLNFDHGGCESWFRGEIILSVFLDILTLSYLHRSCVT
jgi:hypothetical protein